ncbi:MAG: hypothetical protein M1830_006529 [Pleopsidium flavum]|nr:MAG: hypothetical protein M1830_006529 [Pleopsidium flavum]
MFREPEITESKAAIKADPSAPARSAIRRQRSVRYPRDHAPPSRPHRVSGPTDRRSLLEIIRRDRDAPNPNADATVQAEADRARAEASNRLRLENGRALLRDAQSYERPGRRMRIPRNGALQRGTAPPLPPVPASRNYHLVGPVPAQETLNRFGPDGRRLSPPRSIPTPPYTSGEVSSRSSPASNTATLPLGSASLTPRFAPAYRFDELATDPYHSTSSSAAPGPDIIPPEAIHRSTNRSERDNNPSLRRVGHRSITESIHQENARVSRRAGVYVDGLGDRERSFSPEDESWETLLTTIAPDEHLPSASSSFTSATASASSLSSNSASSTNTLITAPSSTSETLNAIPFCDMSDSEGSGTEAEDWEMHDDDDPEDLPSRNPHQYSANVRARSQIIDRQLDEHFNRASLEAAEQAEGEEFRRGELPHMQSVLGRLARRDDIPDEWWAAAGLSRNVGGIGGRIHHLMERIDRLERERQAMEQRERERERQRRERERL